MSKHWPVCPLLRDGVRTMRPPVLLLGSGVTQVVQVACLPGNKRDTQVWTCPKGVLAHAGV
jgi:hypothetical protein